jgi:hypothetical protein
LWPGKAARLALIVVWPIAGDPIGSNPQKEHLTNIRFCSIHVHMLIHGSPIAAEAPSDPAIKDRFWYWTGASGRRYIHSVYAPDDCPPLPGAVFVLVKRCGTMRMVVGVGRFSPFWDGVQRGLGPKGLSLQDADEIHVHLLAKSPEHRDAVLNDLLEAYEADGEEAGLQEADALALQ